MTVAWEYATVTWTYTVAPRKGKEPSDNDWVYKKDMYVWLPGAEQPVHHPISDSEDGGLVGTSALRVYNELGAEGWELVQARDTGSVVGKTGGWYEGSYPVSSTMTFKRPASAAQPPKA
jgi:hypothetical protein